MRSIMRISGLALSLLLVAPISAMAQKSKDTLRIAVTDPFPSLSPYHHSVDEAISFYRQIYERLLDYDERKKRFVPSLAKSWTRINPTTLEFELRDNVSFHNGNKFDADDVVTLVNYISDPNTKTRSANRYTWVKNVEKIGPYKVRIEGKAVSSLDIGYITYFFAMYDGETLNSLSDKELYGRRTPFGTGEYKVVDFDTNRGVTIERFDAYAGNREYSRAPIKRVHGLPIPDRQTQIAEFMAGNIDVVRNVTPETADALRANPATAITNMPTANLILLQLDAVNNSGAKVLSDQRVRKAIWLALDRDALIKHIIPGGEAVEKMIGMCFPDHNVACSISKTAPEYDPAAARKLLAEAGYPNGFEITYDVFTPIKAVGEAIAGELLKVGIRANIQSTPISIYSQRRGKGEQQAATIFYPTQLFPDAGSILENYFMSGGDYSKDPIIHKAILDGNQEFDQEKRAKIYERAFDRNNEMFYTMAIASMPTTYAHTKDVSIATNLLSRAGNTVGDFFWK